MQKISNFLKLSTLSTGVVLASGISSANAAFIDFSLSNENVTADFLIEDTNSGVKFSVGTSPNSDLRGIFFDIANDSLINSLTFNGAQVTTSAKSTSGNITKVGPNNNNLNGTGKTFEAAVEIGKQGAGQGDFFPNTEFTVSSSSGNLSVIDFLNQDIGVRIQSIGGSGGASAKLVGTSPSEPVPEPLTIFGTAIALGAGVRCKRELAKQKQAQQKG